MAAYHNEIDPQAAAWLRELIRQGLIAPGDVDNRSIEDVCPNDLSGFDQCHFFAGVGIWSHVLRNRHWCDNNPIWTGSCPCQPFSTAGQGKGVDDERHLWPSFFWLIKQCNPVLVVGEQVAHKHGAAWFDVVSTDMEAEGYSVGTVVFPACGVGSPHLRQRQYWMAHSLSVGLGEGRESKSPTKRDGFGGNESARSVVHTTGAGLEEQCGNRGQSQRSSSSSTSRLLEAPGPTNGYWRDADWLYCRDKKWRAVEPGSFPLAYGTPQRVGRLRGYGNGLVAPQAEKFIEAVQDIIGLKTSDCI